MNDQLTSPITLIAFLLTHSREFQIAMVIAFSEYLIEWYFFPSLKGNCYIYITAFLIAAAGQAIRTTAMYTGGVSFHHMVQVRLNRFIYPIFGYLALDLLAIMQEADISCFAHEPKQTANRIKRPTITSLLTLESMRTQHLVSFTTINRAFRLSWS